MLSEGEREGSEPKRDSLARRKALATATSFLSSLSLSSLRFQPFACPTNPIPCFCCRRNINKHFSPATPATNFLLSLMSLSHCARCLPSSPPSPCYRTVWPRSQSNPQRSCRLRERPFSSAPGQPLGRHHWPTVARWQASVLLRAHQTASVLCAGAINCCFTSINQQGLAPNRINQSACWR